MEFCSIQSLSIVHVILFTYFDRAQFHPRNDLGVFINIPFNIGVNLYPTYKNFLFFVILATMITFL